MSELQLTQDGSTICNFGKLEYSLEAVQACGLTPDDLWFPTMSIRRTRPVVIYNKF